MRLLKYISKLLPGKEILIWFLIWKIWLFFLVWFATSFIPLAGNNFLGGGLKNYIQNPYLYSWVNFDGEHYFSIVQNGYQPLTHSFFPIYPLIVKIFTFFTIDPKIIILIGLLISNISFLLCLFILRKVILLDYSEKIAQMAVLAIILFPTSFYFGSFYTESLFLVLSLSAVYLMRTNRLLWSGVLGGLSSATRITGIILLPFFLIEWWQSRSKKIHWQVFLIPLGILGYMFYLYQTTGNWLVFYTDLSPFGAQRQPGLTLPPQVFYRYFKILQDVNLLNPSYWTYFAEFFSALLIVWSLLYGYIKKVRLSHLFYILITFLFLSLTGSFSSLPRYLLSIFPLFIILGVFLSNRSTFFKVIYFLISFSLFSLEAILFVRGYWVA